MTRQRQGSFLFPRQDVNLDKNVEKPIALALDFPVHLFIIAAKAYLRFVARPVIRRRWFS